MINVSYHDEKNTCENLNVAGLHYKNQNIHLVTNLNQSVNIYLNVCVVYGECVFVQVN